MRAVNKYHQRTIRPTPHRDPAVKSCICEAGPMVVATFVSQELTGLGWEHCAYCPMPSQALDMAAYVLSGRKVPL